MTYSCSDFYAEVCAVAVQELGTAIPEHDGAEIELDAESVVVSIQRAARERRELLAALRDVLDRACIDADTGALALEALSEIRGTARAAIAKVQA